MFCNFQQRFLLILALSWIIGLYWKGNQYINIWCLDYHKYFRSEKWRLLITEMINTAEQLDLGVDINISIWWWGPCKRVYRTCVVCGQLKYILVMQTKQSWRKFGYRSRCCTTKSNHSKVTEALQARSSRHAGTHSHTFASYWTCTRTAADNMDA